MKITGPTAFLGAVSGFTCVAIGAFGAHMVKDPEARALISTGEQWQILHTMASFAALSFRTHLSDVELLLEILRENLLKTTGEQVREAPETH